MCGLTFFNKWEYIPTIDIIFNMAIAITTGAMAQYTRPVEFGNYDRDLYWYDALEKKSLTPQEVEFPDCAEFFYKEKCTICFNRKVLPTWLNCVHGFCLDCLIWWVHSNDCCPIACVETSYRDLKPHVYSPPSCHVKQPIDYFHALNQQKSHIFLQYYISGHQIFQ